MSNKLQELLGDKYEIQELISNKSYVIVKCITSKGHTIKFSLDRFYFNPLFIIKCNNEIIYSENYMVKNSVQINKIKENYFIYFGDLLKKLNKIKNILLQISLF